MLADNVYRISSRGREIIETESVPSFLKQALTLEASADAPVFLASACKQITKGIMRVRACVSVCS